MTKHEGARADRPGVGSHLRAIGSFWRGAVNDYVVATAGAGAGDVVLDLGAGLGPATIPTAKRGAQVIAVDPSRTMRAGLTVRRTWQRARKRIRVLAGSAERVPLAGETVDVVIAVNTMHHWTDMDASAAEAARVLRAGGRIVWLDEDFDDPGHALSNLGGSHHETYPMIDADAVVASLTAARFSAATSRRLSVGDRPVLLITAVKQAG